MNNIFSFLPESSQIIWKKIERSNIGKRIVKGIYWSLIGSVFSQILTLFASIIVARILGKTEYGELGIIRSTVNMFSVFAGLGLGVTATKYIAEYRITDKVKTGKIIAIATLFSAIAGALIAVIIIFMAPSLSKNTINAPHLVNEIRYAAVMLFFGALNGSQVGTLAGFEAFKRIAKVNLISCAINFPLQIGLSVLFKLPGSVIGFGLGFLTLWILNHFAVQKEARKFSITINYKGCLEEWPVLYKFSLPALFSGILVSPVIWVCNTILVNHPEGFGEMAIFDAANQWRNAIIFIPSVLSQIVLPLLSDSSNNRDQFNRILKYNVAINFIVTMFAATVLTFFSSFIMNTYGTGFIQGSPVLIILAFSTVLISVNGVIGQAIAGKGKMWIGFIFNLIWGIILISMSFIFINAGYGAKGLAFAFLISYGIHTVYVTIYTLYYLMKK